VIESMPPGPGVGSCDEDVAPSGAGEDVGFSGLPVVEEVAFWAFCWSRRVSAWSSCWARRRSARAVSFAMEVVVCVLGCRTGWEKGLE